MTSAVEVAAHRRLLLALCVERALKQDSPDDEFATFLAETLNSVKAVMPQRANARTPPKECRAASVAEVRAFLYEDREPSAVTMRAALYLATRGATSAPAAAPAAVATTASIDLPNDPAPWTTAPSVVWGTPAVERAASPAPSFCESVSEAGGTSSTRISARSVHLWRMLDVCGYSDRAPNITAVSTSDARDTDLCVMAGYDDDAPNGYIWLGVPRAAEKIDGPFPVQCIMILGVREAATAIEHAKAVVAGDERFACRGQWMRAKNTDRDLSRLLLLVCVCAIEANARARALTPRK